MKYLIAAVSATTILFFSACVHKVENAALITREGTVFEYDGSHTVLSWTAYKYTSKVPVSGSFSHVQVLNTAPNTLAAGTLEHASFTIFESSLLSNCLLRDSNIYNRFLRKLAFPTDISGQVVSVSGNNDTGQMVVLLKLNEITDSVTMGYSLQNTTLTATGSVDLQHFNTQNAFDSLAVTCGKFHAGADGISKVWSTVDISVKTVFNISR
jgi:hypothetical protein